MTVRTTKKAIAIASVAVIILATLGVVVTLLRTDAYNRWGETRSVNSIIIDVSVIDPATRTVSEHRDIWIDQGLISKIVPTGSASIDKNRQHINASGKFVIPGLWDMHVHLFWRRYMAPFSLDLFLANGVVAVRDMRSDCWEPRENPQLGCISEARRVQNGIERGIIRGPRILALSSDFINGPWSGANHEPLPKGVAAFMAPRGMADGVRLARYLKARGVDFAKVYDGMTPEAYQGLTAEARRLGLEVAGHHPPAIPLQSLVRSGQKSLEHSKGLVRLCSEYYESYRPIYANLVRHSGEKKDKNRDGNLKSLLDQFSVSRCTYVMRELSTHGVFFVPTLGTSHFDLIAKDWRPSADPRMRYIVPALEEQWAHDAGSYAADDAAKLALYRKRYVLGVKATRLAFDNGVQVILGTDANDSAIYPGFSMHDEMVRLARAGVPEMDVLRAATTVPAAFMGMADHHGGIASGSAADLVILDGNPLDDMAQIRHISTVVVRGRILDRSALNALLEAAAKRVRSFSPRIELVREWLTAKIDDTARTKGN